MTSNANLSIEGILGFPITPYDPNGRVDEQALAENVRFLVRSGLDAIFICAGSGEFQSLDRAEYENAVAIAVAETDGRIPVFAGVGGNIRHALELAQVAAKGGARGLLALPPYLIVPEQEGLYRYYEAIVQAADLPTIVYQRDNAVFTLGTLKRLAGLPRIIGYKDGLGNMELNIEFTQEIGSRLQWMNGMPLAELTMPAYHGLGFRSYSSAISNYIPHVSRLYHRALNEGDAALFGELYREAILPIHRIRQQRKGYAVSLIKAGMQIVGLPVGQTVRAPLVEVEPEHYRQLEAIVKRVLERFPRP